MASQPLIDQWFRLTRERLPALAHLRDWPVRFDHCFQRILLDNAVGGYWPDTIPAPAYRNAPDDVLERAIMLGHQVADDMADLGQLNRQSLEWRGKLKATPA